MVISTPITKSKSPPYIHGWHIMTKLTIGELVELGVDPTIAQNIITKMTTKSTKSHYKYWVYMDHQRAQTLVELFGGDPKFKLQKYMPIVTTENWGPHPTPLTFDTPPPPNPIPPIHMAHPPCAFGVIPMSNKHSPNHYHPLMCH